MKRAIFVFLLTLLGGFATVQVAFAQETRKFLLDGTAKVAQDPLNSANDVIKMDTTNPVNTLCDAATNYQNCAFGTVSRNLGVKIQDLTDELEAKWYFASRSCGGGSPRFQLAIDLNGVGKSDGNAFGYFGAPSTVGCPPNKWTYEDLTDNIPRWDLSQFVCGGGMPPKGPPCLPPPAAYQVPWSVVVTTLSAFPNHVVCTGALVDDSGWFEPAEGVAYYDIIGIGSDTLENRTDVGGSGFAQGCKAPDDDEGEGDDNDHDHMKFQDSASHPENGQMQYHDQAQNMNVQNVNGVNSIAYNSACVSFAGDALVNGNPGYLFTFAACDLSALGTGIGNFSMTVTGPLGFLYQKAAPITSGFVSIHPH